ncbi:hypothetical protein JI721_11965 [Alicyclobacillus cycloheptanicus]|uniref:Uncharacterized protein n=1 Tax=Alicyclobacillus cycloheptanicus TaxID=1457 RepID=A0ABT9XG32_9BACL|nr:hypothetical protein [Alicyclobacillus cycloheptanicus]MDQ0189252.1 hypothetical protein [Alicyclobacillus cycloheptanicus]WDM00435.1 hypothetical protein JI721_11965 [Alicyclobacillus cycloheptanicus]
MRIPRRLSDASRALAGWAGLYPLVYRLVGMLIMREIALPIGVLRASDELAMSGFVGYLSGACEDIHRISSNSSHSTAGTLYNLATQDLQTASVALTSSLPIYNRNGVQDTDIVSYIMTKLTQTMPQQFEKDNPAVEYLANLYPILSHFTGTRPSLSGYFSLGF